MPGGSIARARGHRQFARERLGLSRKGMCAGKAQSGRMVCEVFRVKKEEQR